MTPDKIRTAVATMKGYPPFQEFLSVVEEYQEAALCDFDNHMVVNNPQLLARLTGEISLCRVILQSARVDIDIE